VLRVTAPMQMFFQPYINIVGERAMRLPVAPSLKIAWVDIKDVAPVVLLLCMAAEWRLEILFDCECLFIYLFIFLLCRSF
jgi:hypothetical protein